MSCRIPYLSRNNEAAATGRSTVDFREVPDSWLPLQGLPIWSRPTMARDRSAPHVAGMIRLRYTKSSRPSWNS